MYFSDVNFEDEFCFARRSVLSAPALVKKNICCRGNDVFFSGTVHIAVVEVKPLFVVRILTESSIVTGA